MPVKSSGRSNSSRIGVFCTASSYGPMKKPNIEQIRGDKEFRFCCASPCACSSLFASETFSMPRNGQGDGLMIVE